MTPHPIFELSGITFRYRDVLAIDGLDLTIQPGQRIALVGSNGSGKSTLLRLLDALYFPTSGVLSFEGQTLTEDRLRSQDWELAFRRRVALVFQDPDVQLFCPTVFDELAFGPLQLGWSRQRVLDEVAAMLEQMNLSHLKDRAPHRLSGGEKKRVALASVLIINPDVLLLDEPTAGLDPASQSRIIDMLADTRPGRTVITATHQLEVLEEICDRVCVCKEGRIVADAKPTAILADQALLRGSNLLYAHRHHHSSLVHAHAFT